VCDDDAIDLTGPLTKLADFSSINVTRLLRSPTTSERTSFEMRHKLEIGYQQANAQADHE